MTPILPFAHATNVGRTLLAGLSLWRDRWESCETFSGRTIEDPVLRRRVEKELWYLHVFGIDYALHHIGGTERARRAALDAFYSELESAMDAARHSHAELLRRAQLYTEAVESAGPDEPPSAVGRAFARVCGAPDCEVTRTLGMERFCGALVQVSAVTKSACAAPWNEFPHGLS
jgi:hypothetical protein